jgi:hypothetical protein
MASDRWRKKYEGTASPEEWFRRFASGDVTLKGISRSLGVSLECIRHDFINLVGREVYADVVVQSVNM